MSERRRDDEELDLAVVARDDATLDALGRDEAVADGDLLTEMLTAWRAEVVADTADADTRIYAVGTSGGRDHVDLPAPALPSATGPARSRPPRRRAWRLAAAVIAALVLATGLGVGSRNAGPTSPLWSLTRVLYPERADVSSVEYTIAQARDAAAAGRLDEARQLIEQARRELARVTDPTDAARLRAEIDAVLRDLAIPACPTWPRCGTAPASPALPPAASTPAGPRPSSPAPRTTAPARPPAAPAPSPSTRPELLPSLPGLPPPPLPGPSVLPSLPSPSVLPSLPGLPLPGLPLPTGGLLD
ncbi:hypothetical protein ACFOW4_04040 [Micromonospora sp. GCM10011542]|uniref:hypothetical protein n=1 Tax=Micromonospora sp. GCM10011542 TaxID=3317337 RepID=UPI00360FA3C7